MLAVKAGRNLSTKQIRQLRNRQYARVFRSRQKGVVCLYAIESPDLTSTQTTSTNYSTKPVLRTKRLLSVGSKIANLQKRTLASKICLRRCCHLKLSPASSTESVYLMNLLLCPRLFVGKQQFSQSGRTTNPTTHPSIALFNDCRVVPSQCPSLTFELTSGRDVVKNYGREEKQQH